MAALLLSPAISVSTDVYKRQPVVLPEGGGSVLQRLTQSFDLFLLGIDLLTQHLVPVSYTHLDVYKRQLDAPAVDLYLGGVNLIGSRRPFVKRRPFQMCIRDRTNNPQKSKYQLFAQFNWVETE